MYQDILRFCPTDYDLVNVDDLIKRTKVCKRISGRTIDTLITRYPKFYDCAYLLDITEADNPSYEIEQPQTPGRKFKTFDIETSYRQYMSVYSKQYFDCFGRGNMIVHELRNGEKLNIILCQFMFFIWVHKFRVLDFLNNNYDKILAIRKMAQQSSYQHKKRKYSNKFRKISTPKRPLVYLYPLPLSHRKYKGSRVKL